MTTSILKVHGTSFITGYAGVEMGCGGPDLKSAYLRVIGPDDYVWGTKNDGSTGAGVDCGIDPGTYVAELAGYNSVQVTYPAGAVTAAARAAILAAAFLLQPWCTSVTVAASDNADGSRSIEVVGDYDEIAPGSRTWVSHGAAGPWGSHVFRLAPDIVGAASAAITRNIAAQITLPPVNAQFWGVGLQLGTNVSALAANRPRLYLRVGGIAGNPAGSTVLFDFGQIAASQINAFGLAMITLTPAQATALRAALDTVGGQILWACVEAAAITEYVALPTGGGWNGEMSDLSVRVDVATASDPTVPAPAAWNSAGMLSFPVILSWRLFYEVDPAGNANSFPVWGTLRDVSTFPNVVVLPNTETLQTALTGTGYENGYRIHSETSSIVAGTYRYCFDERGDPSTQDMTGATTILDFGAQSIAGTVVQLAPTGDASIAVPAVISTRFKGTGASGRGATNPLNNTPIQPNDYVRRSDGRCPFELDYAGNTGNPNVAFQSPIAGPTTSPDNLAALFATFEHPADTVTLVPPSPPPPPEPEITTALLSPRGGGGGGWFGPRWPMRPAYVMVEQALDEQALDEQALLPEILEEEVLEETAFEEETLASPFEPSVVENPVRKPQGRIFSRSGWRIFSRGRR